MSDYEPLNLPPSPEVASEEFYDLCAWLRDHDWGPLPPHDHISITTYVKVPAQVWDPSTNEIRQELVEAPIEVQRFVDEDGEVQLHVHAPGVCADIDPDKLGEMRPKP